MKDQIAAELTEQYIDGTVTGHAWFWKNKEAEKAFKRFMNTLKIQGFESYVKENKFCYMILYQKGGKSNGLKQRATKDFGWIEKEAGQRADFNGSPSE